MEFTITFRVNKDDVVDVITEDGVLVGVVTETRENSVDIFIEDYNRTVTYTREDFHLIKPTH